MKAIDPATGQEVDVSPEQAQAGFQSGKLQVPKGAPVPVQSATGKIGTVDPEKLQHVIESGGRIIGQEQLEHAAEEHRYGGLGGSLAAAGEGLLRGASVGLSDPLAIGAARLFGGDDAAEATRRHLEAEQRVHPWLSTGTELAGAILPAAFSGGETAGVTGAELAARGGAEALSLGRAGAEEANVMSRIGQGVRALGAPARAIDAAGVGTEHLVGSLLGSEAETGLGRAAQSAARTAARGVVEGGLWSAGSAVDESQIQNKPLTAEKLFASVGHGALMGGLLGGALGGLGTLAGEGLQGALGAAGPTLDKAASEQAYKWLDARVGVSREALARAGGTEAVGDTVLEHVLKPIVEKDGLGAAAMDPEQKLEAIEGAVQRVGSQIGDITRGNPAQTTLREFLKPIDDQIAKWDKTVLGEEKIVPLQRLRDSVVKQFGGAPVGEVGEAAALGGAVHEPEFVPGKLPGNNYELQHVPLADIRKNTEAWSQEKLASLRESMGMNEPIEPIRLRRADTGELSIEDGIHRFNVAKEYGFTHIPAYVEKGAMGSARRSGEEIGEYLRAHPDAAREFASTGKLPDRAIFREAPDNPAALAGEDLDRPISIEDMLKTRRALQDRVFEDVKALDPDRRVKVLREVSGAWNELEERVLNDASKDAGDLAGTRLRELNKTFQQLKLAEQAVRETTSRYASNRNFGMSEYLTGFLPGMTALLHGNVLGGAAGVSAAIGHRELRKHGNAYAALMLDRLGTMGGISKAAGEVDTDVERAVSTLGRGAPKALPERTRARDLESRFERERERVTQIAALAGPIVRAHLQEQTRPMQPHAPQLAEMVQQQAITANAFLASKLPRANATQTLTPNAPEPELPASVKSAFLRYVDAVQGGPGHIAKKIAAGTASPEDLETLKAVFPESLGEIRGKVAQAGAGRNKPFSYQTRLFLAPLYDTPVDPTTAPAFVQSMQATYTAQPLPAESGVKPRRGSAPAKLTVAKSTAGPFERAAGAE